MKTEEMLSIHYLQSPDRIQKGDVLEARGEYYTITQVLDEQRVRAVDSTGLACTITAEFKDLAYGLPKPTHDAPKVLQ